MVKVLFVGPSLHEHGERPPNIGFRPPASQGELLTAVLEGANVIGLVDGLYESVAAVWHKEILFALSQGVACSAQPPWERCEPPSVARSE